MSSSCVISLSRVFFFFFSFFVNITKKGSKMCVYQNSKGGLIELVIIEGRDLVAADIRGTSDPYVRVHYGNERRRTKVMIICISTFFRFLFILSSDHQYARSVDL